MSRWDDIQPAHTAGILFLNRLSIIEAFQTEKSQASRTGQRIYSEAAYLLLPAFRQYQRVW